MKIQPKDADRIIAHPNMAFGFNPPVNVNLGIIGFTRHICVPTQIPGVFKLAYTTQIEQENCVQAMGRLSRNYDDGALLFVKAIWRIAQLRFKAPSPLPLPRDFQFINEFYTSKSAPTLKINGIPDAQYSKLLYPLVNGKIQIK